VRLRALRVGIIDPCVVSYRGQIIKNTGDGFLATFDSSVDALRCAVEIQREVPLREAATPPDLKIRFRMGLNVGEVITKLDAGSAGGIEKTTDIKEYQAALATSRAVCEQLARSITLRQGRIPDRGQPPPAPRQVGPIVWST
jgi:class 3 adenylate cyclase